jgi:hypothetical protein
MRTRSYHTSSQLNAIMVRCLFLSRFVDLPAVRVLHADQQGFACANTCPVSLLSARSIPLATTTTMIHHLTHVRHRTQQTQVRLFKHVARDCKRSQPGRRRNGRDVCLLLWVWRRTHNCHNVTLRGVTLDSDPPNFAQGALTHDAGQPVATATSFTAQFDDAFLAPNLQLPPFNHPGGLSGAKVSVT